ncbi:MAG: D-alanine--D-alanine ligase [Anaerolineaceae bacterium]|nr:D-alanine--D-alanine ligase [Anaerolineaceae bacterium]
MSQYRIGLVFGGRSVEHEISVLTAHQIMAAMDKEKYEVVPIYIAKNGEWLTGNNLLDLDFFKKSQADIIRGCDAVCLNPSMPEKNVLIKVNSKGIFNKPATIPIDVFFPAIHGTNGEDGTIQGAFEIAKVPYVGCGVLGSAIGMNKIATKALLQSVGVPVIDFVGFDRYDWTVDDEKIITEIKNKFNYPMFVKPAESGSSIGISRVSNEPELRNAIEVALIYGYQVLVEAAQTDCAEINCSVIGYKKYKASVCEQPLTASEFLKYDDKYKGGSKSQGMKGLSRKLPAPISAEFSTRIQNAAISAFKAINGSGIARVDFLANLQEEKFFVNELNTLPGSLAFYLWEASGIKFGELIDQLITYALEAYEEKKQTTYVYSTPVFLGREALQAGPKNAGK